MPLYSCCGLLKIAEFFVGERHFETVSFFIFVYLPPFSFCLLLLCYELQRVLSESEARSSGKQHFTIFHQSSSLSAILNNFCCLRIILLPFLPSDFFHDAVAPDFIQRWSGGTFYSFHFFVCCFVDEIFSALFKLSCMVCLIVLITVAVISEMISFIV